MGAFMNKVQSAMC
jgi:DNA repair exonuclease SbcCD ATPase subunit